MVSVFFRTGERSAATVSWPIYLFAVLPLQLLFGFYRAAAYLAVFVFRAMIAGIRTVRRHEERRPPAR